MGNLLGKVKAQANKAVATVSVKSSTALERGKLNAYISNLQIEIQNMKSNLANRYYEMWKAEQVDFDEIDVLCQQLMDTETLVGVQQQRIRQLEIEEQQILNTVKKEGVSEMVVICPCGARNAAAANFCASCGKPVEKFADASR